MTAGLRYSSISRYALTSVLLLIRSRYAVPLKLGVATIDVIGNRTFDYYESAWRGLAEAASKHADVDLLRNPTRGTKLDFLLIWHDYGGQHNTLGVLEERYKQYGKVPFGFMLAKLFQDESRKYEHISSFSAKFKNLKFVVLPAPRVEVCESATHVSCIFLPLGVEFEQFNSAGEGIYTTDISYTGAMTSPAAQSEKARTCEGLDWCIPGTCPAFDHIIGHYSHLRREMACAIPELRRLHINVTEVHHMSADEYKSALTISKLWPATTENMDHVGPRFYEVMASNRTMLMCDPNPRAYAPIGLVHGVHAVMVTNTSDFIEKVRYYAHPAHEAERRRIVSNAAELVLKNTWTERGHAIIGTVRSFLNKDAARQ